VFDFGLAELLLIGILALIVLGPKRLPEVARTVGRWAARARRFVEDVKRDIDREVGDADLAALKRMHEELAETRSMLQRTADDTLSSFGKLSEDVARGAESVPAPRADIPSLEIFDEPPAGRPAPRARKTSAARKPAANRKARAGSGPKSARKPAAARRKKTDGPKD